LKSVLQSIQTIDKEMLALNIIQDTHRKEKQSKELLKSSSSGDFKSTTRSKIATTARSNSVLENPQET